MIGRYANIKRQYKVQRNLQVLFSISALAVIVTPIIAAL